MFIINLTYKVPLETVDKFLDKHIDYLNYHYDLGIFLASGRKVPRTGGIILASVAEKEDLLKIIEKDPFKINELADYEITEFIAGKTCEELSFLHGK